MSTYIEKMIHLKKLKRLTILKWGASLCQKLILIGSLDFLDNNIWDQHTNDQALFASWQLLLDAVATQNLSIPLIT